MVEPEGWSVVWLHGLFGLVAAPHQRLGFVSYVRREDGRAWYACTRRPGAAVKRGDFDVVRIELALPNGQCHRAFQ